MHAGVRNIFSVESAPPQSQALPNNNVAFFLDWYCDYKHIHLFMELDEDIKQAIATALQAGNLDTALLLLESLGYEHILKLALPAQRTPLHYACLHGRVDAVKRLIANCKCSIESTDLQGHTPLHTAAQHDQVEVLRYLLHRLFDHKMSDLSVKFTSGNKLSHYCFSRCCPINTEMRMVTLHYIRLASAASSM
jgi:ankyrin repeat protein